MMNGFSNFLRLIRGTVRGADSSRQLALGVMLGSFVGLIPKDSLLPYGFVVILIMSSANLLSGASSGFLFTWIGSALDPVSTKLGTWILTLEPLETIWAWLYQLPIVPWTRFENTVVMGSLIIATLIAYPVYRISFYFFNRYGSEIGQKLVNSRIFCWLFGNTAQPQTEG